MTLIKKIILSLVAVFFGTIIFGVVRDIFGHGQYIISGILVFCLIYIWNREGPSTFPASNHSPSYGGETSVKIKREIKVDQEQVAIIPTTTNKTPNATHYLSSIICTKCDTSNAGWRVTCLKCKTELDQPG